MTPRKNPPAQAEGRLTLFDTLKSLPLANWIWSGDLWGQQIYAFNFDALVYEFARLESPCCYASPVKWPIAVVCVANYWLNSIELFGQPRWSVADRSQSACRITIRSVDSRGFASKLPPQAKPLAHPVPSVLIYMQR